MMDLVPTFLEEAFITDIEEQAPTPQRLLLYLLKHPLQRREDLALALCVPSSTISRHVCQLEEQGLLERVKASLGMSNASAWFYLTSRGIEACASLVGADATQLAKLWGADEAHLLRLLPQLQAWLLLQNVINGLIRQAPRLLLPKKEELHTRLRWHWQRNYTHSFVSKGKRTRCFADTVLVLSRQYQAPAASELGSQEDMRDYISLVFLLDTGLVGPHDRAVMQARLHRLLLWRESVERQPHYRHFPPVLVLTHSARGRETWQWCAHEAAVQARLAPLEGAVLALSPDTVIASAFSLSWQRLSSPGPCRLQDLLVTMPREAVPAGVLAPRAVPEGIFDGARGQSTRRTIVKGQFAARARSLADALIHQPMSRDFDEQTVVALLSLEVSRRHLELLLLVYASPLLSGQDLVVLMGLQAETVGRYLYDLRQWNCLASEPSTVGRRFSLAPRGLRLLAAQLCVPLSHLAENMHKRTKGPGQPDPSSLIQRGVPALRRVIRHTSGLYGFIMRLCQAAQTHEKQGHRLLWWETGARCTRRYHYQGRWHNLLPDAQVAYQARDRVVRAWIEWDEGTMKGRDLTIKLSAYRTWVLSREWQREAPVLPLLLFIVPEPGQEGRVQRVARALLQATTLQVYTTTATRLAENGPLEAIWLPIGAFTQGPLPERCSWLDQAHRS